MRWRWLALLLSFSLFSSVPAHADDLSVFLKSCAYGTAAGAVLGLASLAVNENPNDKMNNIARGASLGLYAGIGFGLYTIYGTPTKGSADFADNRWWISPLREKDEIAGARLNFNWPF